MPDLIPAHGRAVSGNWRRAMSRAPDLERFVFEGTIDGQEVGARYDAGHLVCGETLLQPARIVVDLGDRFFPENGPPLAAALDGPALAVLLTLLRACDRVTSVDVEFQKSPG